MAGFKGRIAIWTCFFLSPYLFHLNMAESIWQKLKGGWFQLIDYALADVLAKATNRCLAIFGNYLIVRFSPFKAN